MKRVILASSYVNRPIIVQIDAHTCTVQVNRPGYWLGCNAGDRPVLHCVKLSRCGILVDTCQRERLIDDWAARLKRWGLTPIAPFVLETLRPLGFIGSQAMLIGKPLLTLFIDASSLEELSSLLDDPDALGQIERRLADTGS